MGFTPGPDLVSLPVAYGSEVSSQTTDVCVLPCSLKRWPCPHPSWRRSGRDDQKGLCVLLSMLPIGSEPRMVTKASQTPENSLPLSKHGTEPLLPIISHPVLDQSVDLIVSDSLAH